MDPSQLTGAQRDELMEQLKQQVALATAQELLTKMTEKCFHKCVSKPGTSLDSSEQKCVAMCMDRYMDSWNLVSRTYGSRIQRERSRTGIRRHDGTMTMNLGRTADTMKTMKLSTCSSK